MRDVGIASAGLNWRGVTQLRLWRDVVAAGIDKNGQQGTVVVQKGLAVCGAVANPGLVCASSRQSDELTWCGVKRRQVDARGRLRIGVSTCGWGALSRHVGQISARRVDLEETGGSRNGAGIGDVQRRILKPQNLNTDQTICAIATGHGVGDCPKGSITSIGRCEGEGVVLAVTPEAGGIHSSPTIDGVVAATTIETVVLVVARQRVSVMRAIHGFDVAQCIGIAPVVCCGAGLQIDCHTQSRQRSTLTVVAIVSVGDIVPAISAIYGVIATAGDDVVTAGAPLDGVVSSACENIATRVGQCDVVIEKCCMQIFNGSQGVVADGGSRSHPRLQIHGHATGGVFVHDHITALHAVDGVVARTRTEPVGFGVAREVVGKLCAVDVLDVNEGIGAACAIGSNAGGQVDDHAHIGTVVGDGISELAICTAV